MHKCAAVIIIATNNMSIISKVIYNYLSLTIILYCLMFKRTYLFSLNYRALFFWHNAKTNNNIILPIERILKQ